MFDALDYLLGSINKPGRAVRGLLGGRPHEALSAIPFSDTLGLTDPGDEVTGADLIRKAGLATGSDFGDEALGMGASMALDPLTYLGGLGAFKARGPLSRLLAGPADELARATPDASDAKLFSLFDGLDPIERLKPSEPLPRMTRTPPPGTVSWRSADELAGADPHLMGRPLPEELSHVPVEGDDLLSALTGPAKPVPRSPPQESPVKAGHTFPAAPGQSELPDYDSLMGLRYGDPSGVNFGMVGDAGLDAGMRPSADAHRLAAAAWDDAIPKLFEALGPSSILSRTGTQPEWAAAATRRMQELSAGLQAPEAFGIAQDMLPLLQQQRAQLAELLVMSPVGVAFGQKKGANFAFNPDMVSSFTTREHLVTPLRQMGEDARRAAAFATGQFRNDEHMGELLESIQNPLLRFDPGQAAAAFRRTQVGEAGKYIRDTVTHAAGDGRYIESDPVYARRLAELLTRGTDTFPIDAVKGAVRTSPETRDAYLQLLRQLWGMGIELPGRPLVNPLG